MSTTVDTARLEITTNADEYDAQVRKIEGSTKRMTGSFGQSAMQAGRFVQDFQAAGIMGVANNLEGLAMALGGGAGLAGAMTILASAYLAFKPAFTEFISSFGADPIKEFKSSLDGIQGKIKELQDKPIKLVADTRGLEAAKEQLKEIQANIAALERAKGGRSPDEAAAGSKFDKDFAATGADGRKAVAALELAEQHKQEANNRELRAARAIAGAKQKQLEDAKKDKELADSIGAPLEVVLDAASKVAAAQEQFDKITDFIQKTKDEIKAVAGRTVGADFKGVQAGTDPAARESLANRFLGINRKDLAEMVRGASPEAVEAQRSQDLIDEFESPLLGEEAAAEQARKRKAAADKQKQKDDAQKREAQRNAVTLADAAAKENAAIAKGMGGIETLAKSEIANAVAKGGATLDGQGKLSDADFSKLANAVAAQIRRERPDMNPLQAGAVASQIAANAEGDVANQIAAQAGRGLSQQEIAQQIAAQMQALVAQLANRLVRVEANNRELAAQNRRIGDFLRNDFPTMLGGGHR